MPIYGDDIENVKPRRILQIVESRRTLQAITNGVGDLGMCLSLNLVIGLQMFTVTDLLLRNESVHLAVDCVLLFVFWHLLCSVIIWDLLVLKTLMYPSNIILKNKWNI